MQTTTSIIDYLLTIDTPTLANAIELLKVRPQSEGFTPLSISRMRDRRLSSSWQLLQSRC